MNSIVTHSLPARLAGLVLSLVLAAGASAGPSAQQSAQMQRQREISAGQVPVAVSAATPAMACAHCRTRAVTEFSATNTSGKLAPHATVVGVKHDCAACRGSLATIKGRTMNGMEAGCAICARARPTCCTTGS